MRGRSRLILATVGGIWTGLGVAAIVAPSLTTTIPVVADVHTLVSGVDPIIVLVLAAVGLGGVVRLTNGRDEHTSDPTVEDTGAEFEQAIRTVDSARVDTTAEEQSPIEEVVTRAIAGDDDALSRIRSRLRDVVTVSFSAEGISPGHALATQKWTDDPVAGRFLGPHASSSKSVPQRIKAWLDPRGVRRRRISRTIAAVEALVAATHHDTGDAPGRTAGSESDGQPDGDGGPPP